MRCQSTDVSEVCDILALSRLRTSERRRDTCKDCYLAGVDVVDAADSSNKLASPRHILFSYLDTCHTPMPPSVSSEAVPEGVDCPVAVEEVEELETSGKDGVIDVVEYNTARE